MRVSSVHSPEHRPEGAAAQHFGHPRLRIAPREFERRAERVANGQSEESANGAVFIYSRHRRPPCIRLSMIGSGLLIIRCCRSVMLRPLCIHSQVRRVALLAVAYPRRRISSPRRIPCGVSRDRMKRSTVILGSGAPSSAVIPDAMVLFKKPVCVPKCLR